jgi:hypothetical protein
VDDLLSDDGVHDLVKVLDEPIMVRHPLALQEANQEAYLVTRRT